MSVKGAGYDRLWLWFSLSRSSWLTIPRVLMHEMPDDWQAAMAELLDEWDATWDTHDLPAPYVSARKENRFTCWPAWVLNYRHPNKEAVAQYRTDSQPEKF